MGKDAQSPTAEDFFESMKIVEKYANGFVALEGDTLVLEAPKGEMIAGDRARLEELGWELKENSKGMLFFREFYS